MPNSTIARDSVIGLVQSRRCTVVTSPLRRNAARQASLRKSSANLSGASLAGYGSAHWLLIRNSAMARETSYTRPISSWATEKPTAGATHRRLMRIRTTLAKSKGQTNHASLFADSVPLRPTAIQTTGTSTEVITRRGGLPGAGQDFVARVARNPTAPSALCPRVGFKSFVLED